MRERVRRAMAGYRPRSLPLAGRRESAVMLLVYPHGGEDCVLFQLRTHGVRHHRGEISLPGGGRDAGDPTLAHTALREMHEEIGIPGEQVEMLGQLDDTDTRASNYRITPFVGALRADAQVTASVRARDEVREVLYVPVAHLLSPQSRTWKVVDGGGSPVATPAFAHAEHVIWGATARIVTRFVELLEDVP